MFFTLTPSHMWLKRPVYRGVKGEGKCEGKFLLSHLHALTLTARAGAIRCRRFEAIVNERYDFFDKEKMKGDFLTYFKRLPDKKNSKWQHHRLKDVEKVNNN